MGLSYMMPYSCTTLDTYIWNIYKGGGHETFIRTNSPVKELHYGYIVSSLPHKPECTLYYAKKIQHKKRKSISGSHLCACQFAYIKSSTLGACQLTPPSHFSRLC